MNTTAVLFWICWICGAIIGWLISHTIDGALIGALSTFVALIIAGITTEITKR
jgi:hypothetical protein